jgi:hypothetical protein
LVDDVFRKDDGTSDDCHLGAPDEGGLIENSENLDELSGSPPGELIQEANVESAVAPPSTLMLTPKPFQHLLFCHAAWCMSQKAARCVCWCPGVS